MLNFIQEDLLIQDCKVTVNTSQPLLKFVYPALTTA